MFMHLLDLVNALVLEALLDLLRRPGSQLLVCVGDEDVVRNAIARKAWLSTPKHLGLDAMALAPTCVDRDNAGAFFDTLNFDRLGEEGGRVLIYGTDEQLLHAIVWRLQRDLQLPISKLKGQLYFNSGFEPGQMIEVFLDEGRICIRVRK
jgi:hypothetical protein